MNIEEIVNNFETQNGKGFNHQDLVNLLETQFEDITPEQVYEKMGKVTISGGGYYYHDIALGITLVVEDRDMLPEEWD